MQRGCDPDKRRVVRSQARSRGTYWIARQSADARPGERQQTIGHARSGLRRRVLDGEFDSPPSPPILPPACAGTGRLGPARRRPTRSGIEPIGAGQDRVGDGAMAVDTVGVGLRVGRGASPPDPWSVGHRRPGPGWPRGRAAPPGHRVALLVAPSGPITGTGSRPRARHGAAVLSGGASSGASALLAALLLEAAFIARTAGIRS